MRWPFLCSGYDNQLERLAWLTGTDFDRISIWSPRKIGNGQFRVGYTVATTAGFKRVQVRICPCCAIDALESKGPSGLFQLLEWSVSCLHRCETHGVALITLSRAKTSHETYDVVAQILQHLPDIRKTADAATMRDQTAFETYVRERIWIGVQDDWLNGFNLTQLHRACLTLGVMLAQMPQENVTRLPAHHQSSACQLGLAALVKGPEQLCMHLDWLQSTAGALRPDAASDMGVFYSWLQSMHDDPAVAPIANCVRKNVLRRYTITNKRGILGKPTEEVSHITFDEARKRSGLGVSLIKRLLCHLDGVPCEGAATMTEIKIADLQRVQQFWGELCNLNEASLMLGLRPKHIKALMRLGVLRTIRFGSALRYLKRDEIVSCLADLETLTLARPSSYFLPLRRFCQLKGISVVKLISEWRWGRFDGLFRTEGGHTLDHVLVQADAVCAKQSFHLKRDLTLTETATYLRISVISIRKLRDAGLLVQVHKRNPDTNHRRSYISRESIKRFEARFATIGQVSERCAVAPIHLARRFDRDGIVPVDGPQGTVRVYERDKIPRNIRPSV
jgi:hypothetical protein